MAFGQWYPGCKIRFQLRIEDFAQDAPIPKKAIAPNTGSEGFGLGVEHLKSALNVGLQLAGLQPAAAQLGDFLSLGYDIVPYSVNVERNSYRNADEVKITLPLSRMPFDPRLIRSATVQVFGGVYEPTEWSEAMDSPGAAGLMIRDAALNGESNELFRGFVDDWEMMLSEHDTVQITARDLTSFFIDAELPVNALRDIPSFTRLDDVISLLILGDGLPDLISRRRGLPGVRGLKIVNETGGDLPRLSDIKPPNWFDSKRTVKKGRKRSKKDNQKMHYWDMVTDLCISAGFICFIRSGVDAPSIVPAIRSQQPSASLVITDPRTYYSKSTVSGEELVGPAEVRHFAYGINLKELKIRRKFGGVKVPTIEVRSTDDRTGETLTGRFPISPQNNKPTVSGTGDREEVQVFLLRDISGEGAQSTLDQAARSLYEQLSRGEFEIVAKTNVLAALPQNTNPKEVPSPSNQLSELDADMFRLKAGEPIIVTVDATADAELGRVNAFTSMASESVEEQIERMEVAGVRPDVARQIAEAGKSQFVQREFRLQTLAMAWSIDSGWAFDIKAINFLDIRSAVDNVS